MPKLPHVQRVIQAILLVIVASFATAALYQSVTAADGSGTAVVAPTTAAAGSTGNAHTFTFTAAESMPSGEIAMTAPSDWTAPQAVAGTAGYTTVTSSGGMLANVADTADATTGWAAGSACASGLAVDTSVKHEGVASVRCNNGNEGNNDRWYKNTGAENWSAYTTVGFWLHASAAIAVGNLRFAYDNNANIASPIEQLSFPSAIAANTWTYVVLPFGATARTSVVSYGFVIRNAGALDNVIVRVDDILLGPGAPTFPGSGEVRARLLQMPAGATATISYGVGGGSSGAAAPSALGASTFTTRTRVSDSGALAPIGTSPVITVVAGPLSQFSLNDPGNITAGGRAAYVITRKDQFGHPVTTGAATAYLYSNAAGPHAFYGGAESVDPITSVTFANGASTANVWYRGEQAGAATMTVSDNATSPDGTVGVDDASDSLTVTAAATSQFLLNDPGNVTAGDRLGYVVTRKDQFGNLVMSANNVVYLYSDSAGNKAFYAEAVGGSPVASVTIAEGASSASFWYVDERAGAASVSASDNATAPDGASGVNDAVDTVSVAVAAVAKLLLNNPGDMTVGTRVAYAVTRQDRFGNAVIAGDTTVYLYSSSSGASKAFYDAAVAGNAITSLVIQEGSSSASFWYYDADPGAWTITASDNASAPDGEVGLFDATDAIVVTEIPIVPTRFLLLDPTDAVAGENVTVTVRVVDDAGSVDPTFQHDVTLRISGAATGGGLVDIVNGVGTKTITDALAETVTLTLEDTQGTGLAADASQDVVFAPGEAQHFDLNDPGDTAAGTRLEYVVTRKDRLDNSVAAGALPAYVYASSSTARFYDAPVGGSQVTSMTFLDGASTASFWYENTVAENDTITVSDNATAPDGAAGVEDGVDAVVVRPGAAFKFVMSDPGDMSVGTRLGYSFRREDAYGNAVTAGDLTAYLTVDPAGAVAGFYDAVTGGSRVTSVILSEGQSIGAFWYYDDTAGSRTITVSDNASSPDGASGITDAADGVTVSAAPIVATRYVILDPDDATVGGSVSVTIRAEDRDGNVDTAHQEDVRLHASGSAMGGGLVDIVNGVGTATITDSIAETVTLTLTDPEATGLDVTSTQNIVFRAAGETGTPSSGGGGGGGSPPPLAATILRFVGKAYPGARVALSGKTLKTDIRLAEADVSSADGGFVLEYSGPFDGILSYEVGVSDKQGQVCPPIPFAGTIEMNSTTVRTIFPPPTISLSRSGVLKGNQILVFGYGTPGSRVDISVADGDTQSVAVEEDGLYKALVPTLSLDYGKHEISAQQIAANGERSAFSIKKTLVVSKVLNVRTDLNEDAKVDITDWSIFLSRWRSTDVKLRGLLDMNNDGSVDLTDFSIFIRTIRK